MIGVLHLTLLLDGVLVVLGSGVALVRGGVGWLPSAATALQVLITVQAVVGAVWVARGSQAARPGLFLAYLVASVALLPVAGAFGERTDVRLHAARIGAAAAIALVVQLRLAQLWAERG